MRIGLVSHTSKSTYRLSEFIKTIEKLINNELAYLDTSDILNSFIVGVNLSEFEPSDKLVSHYRNYKDENKFEFTLNLKVEKYIQNDFEQFKTNFFSEFKEAILEVFEKKVKNKNMGLAIIAFVEKALYGSISTDKEIFIPSALKESGKAVGNSPIEYQSLREDLFWKQIENSFTSNYTFDKSIKLLEKNLSREDDSFIIGFQITLRKLIEFLGTESIIEEAEDANGQVTDDSFIYLRCRLITLGKEVYQKLHTRPETLSNETYIFGKGEELLYAADNAIVIKHNEDYNSDMPSSIANKAYGPVL